MKVRRLFWRRAEPRTKQGERDLIVVDRESERGKVGGGKRARAEPSPGLLDFELL